MNTQYRKNLKAVLEASKSYCDERISDLEWQIGTYNYDVATDSNVARIKTLPSDTYKSQVDYIGGKTVKYNQLIQNGNFVDTSGWTGTRAILSVSNNVGTVTSTTDNNSFKTATGYNGTLGHKMLLCSDVKSDTLTTASFNGNNMSGGVITFNITSNFVRQYRMFNVTNSGICDIWLSSNTTDVSSIVVGSSISFRNTMLFDLTDIFGSGNEPTDIATATTELLKFGIDISTYNEYSTGDLKHAITTSVVYSGTDVQDITLTIPSEVLALELDKSVGSVYDVIDFNNKTGTRKVVKKQIKDINVTRGNTLNNNYRFILGVGDALNSADSAVTYEVLNNYGYSSVSPNETYTESKDGFAVRLKDIIFYADKYKNYTVEQFINEMGDCYIQYELNEYISYNLSQYFDTNWNKVDLDNQYATCEMVVAEPIDMPNSITNLIKEVKA